MAGPQPIDSSDSGRRGRPDWLQGAEPPDPTDPTDPADAGAGRATDITRTPGLIGAPGTSSQPAPDARPAPPPPIPLPPRGPAGQRPAPSEPQPPGEIRPWRAASSSVPKLPAFRPSADATPRPPGPGDPEPAARGAHDDPGDLDTGPTLRAVPPPTLASQGPTVLPPLPEAWWMVLVDTIRTQRRAQILTLAVLVLVLAVVILLPQAPRGTPLATIHRTPTAWDGRTVTVSGRVEQAFPLAGGWAFYLVQGRDTMVTFTRTRMPTVGERVVVTGQINTGFLDGIPRQALFEQATP